MNSPLIRPLSLGVVLLSLVLSGCDNSKAVDVPALLVDIEPALQVRKVWSVALAGADKMRLGLQPAVVEGVVYAAGNNGEVLALNALTGKRVWRTNTRSDLSAGPGVGEGVLVAGGVNGQLIALSSADGRERWRKRLTSEVLSRPLVANGMVFVRTVDGRLQALSASDGASRWVYEGVVPDLSLRGTAPPVIGQGMVVAGFDDGRLIALDAATGDPLWSVAVSSPVGRNDLEKLADVDAAAAVVGRDVFVVGYQGKVAMLDADNGQMWWSKDASSHRGFGIGDEMLYLSNAKGEVQALRRTDGNQQWQQASLLHRGLTAPVAVGDSVVVGDYEGYLHWLSKVDGALQARAKTDGERITNAPVVADGRVYVQTDGGNLIAFESRPKG